MGEVALLKQCTSVAALPKPFVRAATGLLTSFASLRCLMFVRHLPAMRTYGGSALRAPATVVRMAWR